MTREGRSVAWRVGEEFAARFDARPPWPCAPPGCDALWDSLRARFPIMFDGPVASAREFSPGSSEVTCERSSYRPYACAVEQTLVGAASGGTQPDDNAPTMFAVTGLIVSRDNRGEERVLLGKRGGGTWLYVGMWELAPSGGVGLPARAELGPRGEWPTRSIARQLWKELAEETGMLGAGAGGWAPDAPSGPLPAARPVALVHDALVRSLDLVLRAEIEEQASPGNVVHARGEYSETAWVAAGELERFVREHRGGVIEPTIATLRLLGYLR